jgi:hypothetical protein
MSKFVVDTDTLQYVSNALTALSQDFSAITSTTNGLTSQELGGRSVLSHLEQFDDSWRYGRSVIDEEISGMSRRLMTAKSVYELIEQKVQHGAKGTIDLGRWGFAHVGGHGHRSGGRGHHGSGTGSGTTTIGGAGSGSGSGNGHRTGTGTTTIGGGQSVIVHSSLLTSDQQTFVSKLAALTGLAPRVVAAWCLAEESGSAARSREAENNNNWLNIGYFDSGRGAISYDQAFENPTTAAEQTAKFLDGSWGGATAGIRHILSVGSDPQAQIEAIASSGWASSGYDGGSTLRATYAELSGMTLSRVD